MALYRRNLRNKSGYSQHTRNLFNKSKFGILQPINGSKIGNERHKIRKRDGDSNGIIAS